MLDNVNWAPKYDYVIVKHRNYRFRINFYTKKWPKKAFEAFKEKMNNIKDLGVLADMATVASSVKPEFDIGSTWIFEFYSRKKELQTTIKV